MSYATSYWISFALFLVLSVAAVIVEVMWLTRRGWTTPGMAVAYVLITDALGLGVGIFTLFAAVGVMMMMAFGGSGMGGTAPEPAYWAVTAFGLLFPALFLLSIKRFLLLLFGIRTGRAAWTYSSVVTLALGIGVFVPPILLFWALMRLS